MWNMCRCGSSHDFCSPSPPDPLSLTTQSRLASLYPEYDIGHMPAAQLSEEGRMRRKKIERTDDGDAAAGEEEEEEEEEEALSSFVANAVMAGDPCAWHVDADPSTFPPSSPWVHNYGYYFNR